MRIEHLTTDRGAALTRVRYRGVVHTLHGRLSREEVDAQLGLPSGPALPPQEPPAAHNVKGLTTPLEAQVVAVVTDATMVGGAPASTAAVVRGCGLDAHLLFSGGREPDHGAGELLYAAPEHLADVAAGALVVVDDGIGRLGSEMLPYRGRFVQAVRCATDEMTVAMYADHEGPRVFTSRGLARYYAAALRPGDAVIPTGVPVPGELGELGEKVPERTVIVGRISGGRATRELLRRRPPEAEVVVVGDGPDLETLREEFPDVTFTGWVDDPGPYYASAGIAVCWSPYPQEGYWRAPFEALAHGCHVVCNDGGDVPWCVPDRAMSRAKSLDHLAAIWRGLARNGPTTAVCAAARRVGELHDERLSLLRWRWLLAREMGKVDDIPPVTVGIVYGTRLKGHLERCLESWTSQTVPVRVVLLHDAIGDTTPAKELRAWVKAHFPAVEYEAVEYDLQPNCRPRVRNRLRELAKGSGGLLVWCDGDCIVAGDAAERLAAAHVVWPHGLPINARQRIERPKKLPQARLDAVYQREFSPVDEQPGWLHKTERCCADLIANPAELALIWRTAGPLTAGPEASCVPWDENILGWGGDDCLWGAEMQRAGHLCVPGVTAWHQEHPRPATDQAESARNLAYLKQKLGLR